jgi:hypothetical protein
MPARGKDMTKQNSMKRALIAAAICLVAVGSFLANSGSGSQSSQDQRTHDEMALRAALNRGGLREAAKLKGHYVAEYDPHWWCLRLDVEALTKDSVALIVGRFTKKLAARIPDYRVIYTDYEVAVDEVVKGNLKQAKTIVITVPGGRVDFEDGTSAEQTTPTFEQPRIGRTYTLFLTTENAVPSVFFLMGGPQGMFDIEDISAVKSHGREDDLSAVETKGQNRESFLKNVRELVRKWPNPGK